jgi:hypothetical protein
MRAVDLQKLITLDRHLFWYGGRLVQQAPEVLASLDALADIVSMDPPMRLIEVGTAEGGFSCVLRDHDVSRGVEIVTFDVVEAAPIEGVEVRREDVWDEAGTLRAELGKPGRTLLFCDGKDKPREVRTFAPLLKSGDVLLAHDYARDSRLGWADEKYLWGSGEVELRDVA